jgi:hypothetical protein
MESHSIFSFLEIIGKNLGVLRKDPGTGTEFVPLGSFNFVYLVNMTDKLL